MTTHTLTYDPVITPYKIYHPIENCLRFIRTKIENINSFIILDAVIYASRIINEFIQFIHKYILKTTIKTFTAHFEYIIYNKK